MNEQPVAYRLKFDNGGYGLPYTLAGTPAIKHRPPEGSTIEYLYAHPGIPREPTYEMKCAALQARPKLGSLDAARDVWMLMYDAALGQPATGE